jgi:DNA-binding NtrC family response regulator
MSILASWIGLADFAACNRNADDDLGPVGLALQSGEFAEALLLTDRPEASIRTYDEWLRIRAPNVAIEPKQIPLSSPSAFAEVFSGVSDAIDERMAQFERADEVLFYLSPGTPVMAATWLILGKTRYASLRPGFLESSQRRLNRLDVPFDLAANILPDVVRAADEQVAARGEGKVMPGAGFGDIVYEGPEMQHLVTQARKIARRSLDVLIEGESGTGKELLANAIHQESLVAQGPFVAVNCGAIPENLVESELFGHVKGAFSGAISARAGYLEAAHGGTLFLDEIGELSRAAQVRLLRVLQERKVIRVGSTEPRTVNIRVIAATNRDLAQDAAEGRFREDLFYRLCVAKLVLPPLRERTGDLNLLLDRLLEKLNAEGAAQVDHKPRMLTAAGRERLLRHEWRGNVRELQNTLQRLVFLSDNTALTEADVDAALIPTVRPSGLESDILGRPLGGDLNLKAVQAEVARHYMERALQASGDRISQAAKLVGTSRQNFSNWMRDYGI